MMLISNKQLFFLLNPLMPKKYVLSLDSTIWKSDRTRSLSVISKANEDVKTQEKQTLSNIYQMLLLLLKRRWLNLLLLVHPLHLLRLLDHPLLLLQTQVGVLAASYLGGRADRLARRGSLIARWCHEPGGDGPRVLLLDVRAQAEPGEHVVHLVRLGGGRD